MVRTQIYLPLAQHRALRKRARAEGISMTEMIRRLLAQHLEERRGIRSFSKEDVLSFVAIGASGRRDTSERHDDALDEALRRNAAR
jgi:hypothetical protein